MGARYDDAENSNRMGRIVLLCLRAREWIWHSGHQPLEMLLNLNTTATISSARSQQGAQSR